VSPLLFVNWHRLNRRFRALMWLIAAALTIVVLFHAVPTQAHNDTPQQRLAPTYTAPPYTAPAGGHSSSAQWSP